LSSLLFTPSLIMHFLGCSRESSPLALAIEKKT
jgi:hypothetical protein